MIPVSLRLSPSKLLGQDRQGDPNFQIKRIHLRSDGGARRSFYGYVRCGETIDEGIVRLFKEDKRAKIDVADSSRGKYTDRITMDGESYQDIQIKVLVRRGLFSPREEALPAVMVNENGQNKVYFPGPAEMSFDKVGEILIGDDRRYGNSDLPAFVKSGGGSCPTTEQAALGLKVRSWSTFTDSELSTFQKLNETAGCALSHMDSISVFLGAAGDMERFRAGAQNFDISGSALRINQDHAMRSSDDCSYDESEGQSKKYSRMGRMRKQVLPSGLFIHRLKWDVLGEAASVRLEVQSAAGHQNHASAALIDVSYMPSRTAAGPRRVPTTGRGITAGIHGEVKMDARSAHMGVQVPKQTLLRQVRERHLVDKARGIRIRKAKQTEMVPSGTRRAEKTAARAINGARKSWQVQPYSKQGKHKNVLGAVPPEAKAKKSSKVKRLGGPKAERARRQIDDKPRHRREMIKLGDKPPKNGVNGKVVPGIRHEQKVAPKAKRQRLEQNARRINQETKKAALQKKATDFAGRGMARDVRAKRNEQNKRRSPNPQPYEFKARKVRKPQIKREKNSMLEQKIKVGRAKMRMGNGWNAPWAEQERIIKRRAGSKGIPAKGVAPKAFEPLTYGLRVRRSGQAELRARNKSQKPALSTLGRMDKKDILLEKNKKRLPGHDAIAKTVLERTIRHARVQTVGIAGKNTGIAPNKQARPGSDEKRGLAVRRRQRPQLDKRQSDALRRRAKKNGKIGPALALGWATVVSSLFSRRLPPRSRARAASS